jgi:uridine phosphorylase
MINKSIYHKNRIAPYVLVPGSEKRVERFVSQWDSSHRIIEEDYLLYNGRYQNNPISACSTGCGGVSVCKAIEMLIAMGGKTFLRVGVTGGIKKEIKAGDLIIATGAVRMDRTSENYVFVEYPAIANYEITCALIAAAERNKFRYHAGIVATAATFYAGEGAPCFGGYKFSGMDNIESDLRNAKVLDWDNETAPLFTLCSLYGLRAGRINAVVDDPETGHYNPIGEEKAIQTALEAMQILAYWDSKKEHNKEHYILPDIPANI